RPMIAWDHGGEAEILAAMFPQGAVKPLDFKQLELRARDFLQQQPLVEASNAFSLETSMRKHLDVYQELMMDQSQ
ncbi:MAG: glycosyl transferase, partial [Xanthomonadales bacterium]|nr:glycosyl transferase [Xanthomonadales bacterium]